MLRALTIAAALALTGCASAVYDSLERRGVDARAVLIDRVGDARDDAVLTATRLEAAARELSDAKTLEGPMLARQLDMARASAQDAAVAAQDLRLSGESMSASGARYLREWEEEIALYQTPDEKEAAAAKLKAQAEALDQLSVLFSTANLSVSPALTLLNEEIAELRKNPTSGVVVTSRAGRIDAATDAAVEAARVLRNISLGADRFLFSLSSAG